jgi:virginiamycin A acetyltransferase
MEERMVGGAAPDPDRLYPNLHKSIKGVPVEMQRVVFLKSLVQSPFTSVGDFTYYDDLADPTGFERRNVLYHYGPERLVIGKYCALAAGVRFIMGAANHRLPAISTYPFPLFGGAWTAASDLFADRPRRGDTVVGNDVWIGYQALIMPGVRIGDGAIVGAASVVANDVPPYGVVSGNPAELVRIRYPDRDVARLLRIAWWDWPVEEVTRHLRTIMGADVDALEAIAVQHRLVAEPLTPAPPGTRAAALEGQSR